MKLPFIFLLMTISCFFIGCQSSLDSTLKVAATSTPHAEILEFIKPTLKEKGVELSVIVIDDFNTPNRALADKEVDANFFQHLPFLEAQKKDFHYAIEPLVNVHLEPMGLYSKTFTSMSQLPEQIKIAIPSDPSNQARALLLLERAGIIQLKHKNSDVSVLDVIPQSRKVELIEIDSPLLTRTLDDADAAVISTNFALQGGFAPSQDALVIESQTSPYANLVAIRSEDKENPDLIKLKETLTTDEVRQWINLHYPDAVIPAF